MELRFFHIVFEGMDRSGKDSLRKYFWAKSKYKNYGAETRGLLSQMAYNKLYSRGIQFDLTKQKDDAYYIYLTVDKDDWINRCKMTDEPEINYDLNRKAFDDTVQLMKNNGYTILEYNTTHMTIHDIAEDIFSKLQIEKEYEDGTLS